MLLHIASPSQTSKASSLRLKVVLRLFPHFPIQLSVVVLLISSAIFACSAEAENSTTELYDQLDERFQEFSSFFFQNILSPQESREFHNIAALKTNVQSHLKQERSIKAIASIAMNLELIQRNVDSAAAQYFLTLLLKYNVWEPAEALFESIQHNGNKISTSNARFVMAKHYMKRHKWQKALDYLDGISNKLAPHDSDHALLLEGVALQRLKKHREAIEIYERGIQTTQLAPFVMLNQAIAYLRQDWWTDAHITIENQLKQSMPDEMTNRLYVVLGYSFMRQEYYRNARDMFRNVSLDSRYTNQALLGISLTAINQNDLLGGLNAANILKNKKANELPSEEAFLLVAFIYSRLEQYHTASAAYNEAIARYIQQINFIKDLLAKNDTLIDDISITDNNNTLVVNTFKFDFSHAHPQSLLENYDIIRQLSSRAQNHETKQPFNNLLNDYNAAINNIAREFLNKRIIQLNSYIDQSRYGLALLYDNSVAK